MAKSFFCTTNTGAGITVNSATTAYFSIVGNITILTTTETERQSSIRPAGTSSGLIARISVNTVTASSTIRSRKNLANGNQSVSIESTATGNFEDTENTDTWTAGDDACYQLVTGNTGTSLSVVMIGMYFEPTDTTLTVTKMVKNMASSFTAASTTRYFSFNTGSSTTNTTEANAQLLMKKAGSLKYLDVIISANSRTTTTTVKTRKGGANGAQSISIGSTATGEFEDNTNSDTIAAGNLVNYAFTTGTGTLGITLQSFAVSFESASSANITPLVATSEGGITRAASATHYFAISGVLSNVTGNAETNYLIPFRIPGTLSNLVIKILNNTAAEASTGVVRVDQTNTSITTSIGAGSTGTFEDTTHTTSIVDGNIVTYAITNGAGGSLSYIGVSAWLTVTTGGQLNPITIDETSVSLSESLTKYAVRPTTISDTPTISVSESLARISTYLKPISDTPTVSISESLAKYAIRPKTISDTPIISVSESLTRISTYLKPISDTPTVSISESLTKFAIRPKTISDTPTVSVSETLARVQMLIKTISDTPTVSISESIARIQSLIKLISDPEISTGDSVTGLKSVLIFMLESRIKWYYSLVTRKIPEGET